MKKRILLVDDIAFNIEFEEKIIRSLMSEVEMELQIESASTLADAIESVEGSEPYDAMIVDISLPDGSGVELAKIARQKSAGTRIAALTIYPDRYENERKLFDLFLKKPIMPEAYRQNFSNLLQLK